MRSRATATVRKRRRDSAAQYRDSIVNPTGIRVLFRRKADKLLARADKWIDEHQ